MVDLREIIVSRYPSIEDRDICRDPVKTAVLHLFVNKPVNRIDTIHSIYSPVYLEEKNLCVCLSLGVQLVRGIILCPGLL